MQSRDLDQVALRRAAPARGRNERRRGDRPGLRERPRPDGSRRLVRTLTAQGRMARWIVSLLPVGSSSPCTCSTATTWRRCGRRPAARPAMVLAAVMVVHRVADHQEDRGDRGLGMLPVVAHRRSGRPRHRWSRPFVLVLRRPSVGHASRRSARSASTASRAAPVEERVRDPPADGRSAELADVARRRDCARGTAPTARRRSARSSSRPASTRRRPARSSPRRRSGRLLCLGLWLVLGGLSGVGTIVYLVGLPAALLGGWSRAVVPARAPDQAALPRRSTRRCPT